MDFAELKATPASDDEMTMVTALGAEVGLDPYSLLATKSAGDRLDRAEISYVMTLLTARQRFMPVVPRVQPPAPATSTLPSASAAQLKLLTRLGQEVTGDGAGYLRDLLAKGGAATTIAASAEIKRLKSLPMTARPVKQQPAPATRPLVTSASGHATTNAPPGRYAVQMPGTDYSGLFQVSKPDSGRWAGHTFVTTVPIIEGSAPEPVRGPEAVFVLNAIEENPRGSAGVYGRMTGRCGLCNRRLSNDSSKALGIGQECMARF